MLKDVPIAVIIFRTVLLYGLAFLVFRVMGKRAVGKMAPFDVAVIIIIGEAVALGMETKTPLLASLIPIVILGFLQYGLAWLNLRSHRLEEVTQGFPTLIVKDGRPIEENLRHERVSQADLMMGLREQGLSGPGEVAEAFLEATGKVSVIMKKSASPLTPGDLSSSESVTKLLDTFAERLKNEFRQVLQEERKI